MRARGKDYLHRKSNTWNLLVKESIAEYAQHLVKATGEPLPTSSISRSVCQIVTLPDGRRVFRKLLRHGGILAPLLGGLFVSKRRILRTLRVSAHLREHSIPSPDVLAVGWRTILPHIYNNIIITECVDATPLGAALRRMSPEKRRECIIDAAQLLRSAFESGVEQTDMHADNILLDEKGRLLLSDVESIRLHKGEVPLERRIKVVLRLGRAVVKHNLYPDTLSTSDILRFVRSAAPDADARVLCTTLKRDLRLHSLLWHRPSCGQDG